jgi:hypothetical protein
MPENIYWHLIPEEEHSTVKVTIPSRRDDSTAKTAHFNMGLSSKRNVWYLQPTNMLPRSRIKINAQQREELIMKTLNLHHSCLLQDLKTLS